MYEMIAGKRPFSGDTPLASALKRLTQPPPSASDHAPGLDACWEAAMMRCLEREPARRFQNPKDVVRALKETPAPTQTLTGERMRAVGSRKWQRVAIAAVAGFALLVAASAGVWYLGRHRPPAAALRWYEEGTRALRDGISFTAMNAFERAVQLDPDFTLAHARLAEAAAEAGLHGQSQDGDAARLATRVSILLSAGGGEASTPGGVFRSGEGFRPGGGKVQGSSRRKRDRRNGPPSWSISGALMRAAVSFRKRLRAMAHRSRATASSRRRFFAGPCSKDGSR